MLGQGLIIHQDVQKKRSNIRFSNSHAFPLVLTCHRH
uniref:Uncharacterized protein n=1 Tax=Arundo donax TaxID=35708 RepID=A0A0A9E866_ARUDO